MLWHKQMKMKPAIVKPMAAVVVFSLLIVGTQTALGTISIPLGPGADDIGTWDSTNGVFTLNKDVTEGLQIDQDNLTLKGNGKTIDGSGSGYGVYLYGRTGVTLQNLTVKTFEYGIYLDSSSGNTLIANVASNNTKTGIRLNNLSENNVLRGNQANANDQVGIVIYNSRDNFLRNNTMWGNRYNFRVHVRMRNDIDTSNLVDGRPIYYIIGAVGTTYDSSTNAGTFYAIECDGITIKDLTPSNNAVGIVLWNTHNSTVENVTASNNYDGIVLSTKCSGNTLIDNTATNNDLSGIAILTPNCSSNTLTGNVCSFNNDGTTLNATEDNVLMGNRCDSNVESGINLWESDNNTLEDNTCWDNMHGIRLRDSSNNSIATNAVSSNIGFGIELVDSDDNQIVNNYFTNNPTQALVDVDSTGNVFHLSLPTGGNYWSDWTSPDADGDGIVDAHYVFSGGQDDLPWAQPDGWILARIESLIEYIASLDLPKGLTNSLGAKLNAAEEKLSDGNSDNDVAAVGQLEAFINAVEAQRGKQISEADADELIVAAQEIIALLSL